MLAECLFAKVGAADLLEPEGRGIWRSDVAKVLVLLDSYRCLDYSSRSLSAMFDSSPES